MADRRRRRRDQTAESEHNETEEPTHGKVKPRESECESELDDKEGSGYESISEDVEDDYTYTEDYSEDGESVIIETDSYYEDENSMFGERERGDGEEQPEGGELDADEDKKNPAYVPKRGTFYEHDSREADEDERAKADARRQQKKKLWLESNKWIHDRYDESQQAPKSRDELVYLYGYDIRAHSEPPESVPFMNKGQERRGRGEKYELGDFMESRVGRGRGRGSRGRGRGRGVPGRPGPGNPPGPPPDRWVGDSKRPYSEYKSRGRDNSDRYENSGSESFARDTSPNDPNQRRRPEYDNRRNNTDQQHRQARNTGNQIRNEVEDINQERKFGRRPDDGRYAGGDNNLNNLPKSQDARYDESYREKQNAGCKTKYAATAEELTQEQGLENLLDIAPPLTTIETRTSSSILRADEGPQRRTAQPQDQRGGKKPPAPKGRGDPSRKHEGISERPPRFREQAERTVQTGSQVTGSLPQPHDKPREQRQTKRYSTQRQRTADTGSIESPPPAVAMMVPPAGIAMVPRGGHPSSPDHQSQGHPPVSAGSSPRMMAVGPGAAPRMTQPAYFPNTPAQGVYRQPPPFYRQAVPRQAGIVTSRPVMHLVTSARPVLSQQQQQQLLLQQQALAMQGKATVPMGRVSQQPMYTMGAQQAPPRASMATARPPPGGQLMATLPPAAQYIATPLVTGPPPPGYAMQPQVAYPAGDGVPVSAAPYLPLPPQGGISAAQVVVTSAAPGPGQPPAIHVRGGTTYFHPHIQPLKDMRSPARRAKEPIPIVDPQTSHSPAGEVVYAEEGYEYSTEGVVLEAGQYVDPATGYVYSEDPLAYETQQAEVYGQQEQYEQQYTDADAENVEAHQDDDEVEPSSVSDPVTKETAGDEGTTPAESSSAPEEDQAHLGDEQSNPPFEDARASDDDSHRTVSAPETQTADDESTMHETSVDDTQDTDSQSTMETPLSSPQQPLPSEGVTSQAVLTSGDDDSEAEQFYEARPAADDAIVAEETVAKESVTEETVTDETVTEEPVTEEPVTEEHVTKEPVTEEPVTEEPVTEEPVTEEPVTEDTVASTEQSLEEDIVPLNTGSTDIESDATQSSKDVEVTDGKPSDQDLESSNSDTNMSNTKEESVQEASKLDSEHETIETSDENKDTSDLTEQISNLTVEEKHGGHDANKATTDSVNSEESKAGEKDVTKSDPTTDNTDVTQTDQTSHGTEV